MIISCHNLAKEDPVIITLYNDRKLILTRNNWTVERIVPRTKTPCWWIYTTGEILLLRT